MNLKDTFERVVCISLKRREDRRRRLRKLIKESGFPFAAPKFMDAIDGGSGLIPVGNNFRSGGGAWGCRQSWVRVLEEAMTDGVESLLVLEDDAIWRPSIAEECEAFFEDVPSDWQIVFLGGQNMKPPANVAEGVGRTRNTQRTHAIGFRREGMRWLYRITASADRHIDHKIGAAMAGYNKAYEPIPFIIGQDATQSDISGRKDNARFWTAPGKNYPIVWLDSTQEVAEALIEYGLHYGFDIDENGNDSGLKHVFPQPGLYRKGLGKFLSTVAWEAASFTDGPGVVTIWNTNATREAFDKAKRDIPARTILTPFFDDIKEAVSWLTEKLGKDLVRLRPDRQRLPVLLLKSPDEVVKGLTKNRIVHCGRWIDKNGIDKGLTSFFECGGTSLDNWFRVLEKEAKETNSFVGIHHPKATVDIAETTGRRVIVVDATTYEEAIRQIEGR